MIRALIVVASILGVMTVSGCGGYVRGDRDVETEPGSGSAGKGPGLITGRQGGIVIYQT